MGYKLLGMVVWKAGKWYLARRIDTRKVLVVGGLAAVGAGAAFVVLRGDDD